MSVRFFSSLIAALLLLVGCANDPNSGAMVNQAITAMGGMEQIEGARSVVRRGSGSQVLIGQVRTPADSPSSANLANYVEAVDFVGARAALQYDMEFGSFRQHRREVLTKHGSGTQAKPVGYQMVGERGTVVSTSALYGFSPYGSPQQALGRDLIRVLATAAEETGSTTRVAFPADFHGTPARRIEFDLVGHTTRMYFDQETSLPLGFELTETDPYLGDIPVQYILSDYRDAGGLLLPHEVRILRDGMEVSHLTYDEIALNENLPESDYRIPEEMTDVASEAADDHMVPMELVRLSAGVYHARGFSHNSLVVEFPDYLVVVEAPVSEAQTEVLSDKIREVFPLKPIDYVVVTHPHPDHVGGLRRFAAMGATILVEARHQGEIQAMLEARHGYVRDELSRARDNAARRDNIGQIEAFEGQYELSARNRSLVLHAIEGSPHVEPAVLAFLPREGILFESDLYTPGAPAATPEAANLFQSIQSLGLDVRTIVGGHGGSADFDELSGAVEGIS